MEINNPHADGNQYFYDFSNVQSKTETIEILKRLATTVEQMAKANVLDKKVSDKVNEAVSESQKSGNSQIVVKRLSEAQTLLGGVETATKLIGEFLAVSELVRKFF